MRIIFVRHGHPDYKKDCLTDLGNLQAKAASLRLKDETINEIHSSSCGRAYETANWIAKDRNITITTHDFMREISWGLEEECEDVKFSGHPWSISSEMVKSGIDVMDQGFAYKEPFSKNIVLKSLKTVGDDFDRWLSSYGLVRQGNYYFVEREYNGTILMASHAGSSSAVFAHIFNMPFPFVCASLTPSFTAITIVTISGEVGKLTTPKFEILNDARHIKDLSEENFIGR